mmetsp:Transcript_172916/g.420638  ORF Transcript_172916/g.420638 Transcript_172916/m.420638 type:complete len:433 (+) Transcript_172916:1596-2894(+)
MRLLSLLGDLALYVLVALCEPVHGLRPLPPRVPMAEHALLRVLLLVVGPERLRQLRVLQIQPLQQGLALSRLGPSLDAVVRLGLDLLDPLAGLLLAEQHSLELPHLLPLELVPDIFVRRQSLGFLQQVLLPCPGRACDLLELLLEVVLRLGMLGKCGHVGVKLGRLTQHHLLGPLHVQDLIAPLVGVPRAPLVLQPPLLPRALDLRGGLRQRLRLREALQLPPHVAEGRGLCQRREEVVHGDLLARGARVELGLGPRLRPTPGCCRSSSAPLAPRLQLAHGLQQPLAAGGRLGLVLAGVASGPLPRGPARSLLALLSAGPLAPKAGVEVAEVALAPVAADLASAHEVAGLAAAAVVQRRAQRRQVADDQGRLLRRLRSAGLRPAGLGVPFEAGALGGVRYHQNGILMLPDKLAPGLETAKRIRISNLLDAAK